MKMKFFTSIAVLICAVMLTVGCSKDDDGNSLVGTTLVGTTWVCDDPSFDGYAGLKSTLYFIDDSSLKETGLYDYNNRYGDTESWVDIYTYYYDGTTLMIVYDDTTDTAVYNGGSTLILWDCIYTKQ